MKRIVGELSRLPVAVRVEVDRAYPEGVPREILQPFVLPDGKRFYALELVLAETCYLVKVGREKAGIGPQLEPDWESTGAWREDEEDEEEVGDEEEE